MLQCGIELGIFMNLSSQDARIRAVACLHSQSATSAMSPAQYTCG